MNDKNANGAGRKAPTARTDAEQTVLDFMAAWQEGDADLLMSYFAPDARFHNAANPGLEISELVGQGPIREYLVHLCATQETDIEVRRIASDDAGTVFAERLDVVRQLEGGREPFTLPIVGVLTISDGKILEWGEYFDARVAEAGLGFDPYAGDRN